MTPLDFPWRPGMLVQAVGDMPAFRVVNAPGVVVKEAGGYPVVAEGVSPDDPLSAETGWLYITRDGQPEGDPDPNDDATLGALLGAVREAYDVLVSPVYGFDNVSDTWRWTYHVGAAMPAALSLLSAPTEFALHLAAWNARPVRS